MFLPLAGRKGARGLLLTTAAMPCVVGRWVIRAALERAAVVRSIAPTGLSAHLPVVEVLAAVIRLVVSRVVSTGVAEATGKNQAKLA